MITLDTDPENIVAPNGTPVSDLSSKAVPCPHDLPGLSGLAQVALLAVEVARDDALGGGPSKYRADWVTVIEARDWLRHDSRRWLDEMVQTGAVPTEAQFKAWLNDLENKWFDFDNSEGGLYEVGVIEDEGAVRRDLVDLYLAQCRLRMQSCNGVADRVQADLEALFEGATETPETFEEIGTAIARGQATLERIEGSLEENIARLERLTTVTNRRGISEPPTPHELRGMRRPAEQPRPEERLNA